MTEHLTQQQRDDYIEESKRHALEVLQIPEVRRRLGDYTDVLITLTGSIEPVRVESDIAYAHETSPKRVPATVMRAGESALRLLSPPGHLDDIQRESLQRGYGEHKAQDIESRYARLVEGKTRTLQLADEIAHTHTDVRYIGDDGEIIKGRPMLVFNRDRSAPSHTDAPVTLHELMHVRQARKVPIWGNPEILTFDARDLSGELEGYSVAAMTILGIQDAGRQAEFLTSIPRTSLERTLEIEEIRAHANKYEADPYAATYAVANELTNREHGITDFLANKIRNK